MLVVISFGFNLMFKKTTTCAVTPVILFLIRCYNDTKNCTTIKNSQKWFLARKLPPKGMQLDLSYTLLNKTPAVEEQWEQMLKASNDLVKLSFDHYTNQVEAIFPCFANLVSAVPDHPKHFTTWCPQLPNSPVRCSIADADLPEKRLFRWRNDWQRDRERVPNREHGCR